MKSKPRNSSERLREELLGQLRYLIHEVESLKGIVDRVPVKLQEGRPLKGDLSIKETFALLACLDEEIHQPFVQAISQNDKPEIRVDKERLLEDANWNDREIEGILERVQESRSELISALEELTVTDWQKSGRTHGEEMDVFELVHFITQHDVDRMREMGYRLHESQMTSTNS